MRIAIDFDGTICEEKNYPSVGDPVPGAIETVLDLFNEGGNHLILNTLREGDILNEIAVPWLIDHRILHCFCNINKNIETDILKWKADPRKIAADMYIDDRAFGWAGWGPIRDHFGFNAL